MFPKFLYVAFSCALSAQALVIPTFTPKMISRQIVEPMEYETQRNWSTPELIPMIETCVITLNPITNGDGSQSIQEVRSCTSVPAPVGTDLNNVGSVPASAPVKINPSTLVDANWVTINSIVV